MTLSRSAPMRRTGFARPAAGTFEKSQFRNSTFKRSARREARPCKSCGARASATAHPLAWHKKQAQRALNAWVVHVRDRLRPCISCQVPSDGPHHAGHYRTRGAAPHLALDRRNVAKQCARCNLDLNGNPAGFRAGLVLLHGEAFVTALEGDQATKKNTAADFDQLAAFYRAELRKFKETSS